MFDKIKARILEFLYNYYQADLIEINRAIHKEEMAMHSRSIIYYIQEQMEQGQAITIVCSKELGESEFGIVTSDSGVNMEDLEEMITDRKNDGKKVH